MRCPSVIRFDPPKGVEIEFTSRICHALALALHDRNPRWDLAAVQERGKDGPSHIVCARERPPETMPEWALADIAETESVDVTEYVDVRGIFTDPTWLFKLEERPVGRVEPITRARVEQLQSTRWLTNLSEHDRRAGREASSQVEKRVAEIDQERPYAGGTVITPPVMVPSEDGRLYIENKG